MFDDLIAHIQSEIHLTETEVEKFKSFWKVFELSKDDYLLRNGDLCMFDSYVVKGCLKAYCINTKTGKEDILFFATEKWWATDLDSFVNKTPSIYNLKAIENTTMLRISRESFIELLDTLPKLEKYFRIILERYIASMQRRVIILNSYTAEEKYQHFIEQYPSMLQRVPQYLIASYLGVTPEFLSRVRGKK